MRYDRLFLAMALLTCGLSSQNTRPVPRVVSTVQLIATPEKFDGEIVAAIGFFRLEHEANLLYPSKEDYENVVLANALWVDTTDEMVKEREKLALKYVRIVGTFRAGHAKRNLYSPGGITDIKSCQFWSDPLEPREHRLKATNP